MSNNDNLCVNNFGKICRTCLVEGDMKFLYEKCPREVCLIEMLMSITFLQISEKDGLPVQICSNCESELTKAYRFAQKSLEVDKKLRKCFQEYEGKINSKIKSASPQTENTNSLITTDKQTTGQENAEQIKTEIDVEEHKIEIRPEMVLVKHEIFSEEENNGNEDKDENIPQNESVDKDDSDFLPENENNVSNTNIGYDIKKENSNSKPDKQPTIKTKPKISTFKEGPPYECKKCLEKFATNKLLCLHRKEVKHQNRINCKICSKSISAYKMTAHMRTHTGEKPFCCEVCGMRFGMKERLTRHFMLHTGKKPHKCTICGKGFIQLSKLKEHMRIHSGEKPFVCNYCGKQFRLKNNLDIHLKTHTGEKPHKCSVCGKCFAHYSTLKTHLRIHTGEKPFICNYCNQRFLSKAGLNEHIKDHTGLKPHSCQICGKTFRQAGNLKNHILTHTGEKPFECNICNRGFTKSEHLTYHLRTHSGEKPFSCEICGKSFSLKYNLTIHTRIHTGETPYLCPICNKGFRDSSSMHKHKRKHDVT